jgi:hypothetical protein
VVGPIGVTHVNKVVEDLFDLVVAPRKALERRLDVVGYVFQPDNVAVERAIGRLLVVAMNLLEVLAQRMLDDAHIDLCLDQCGWRRKDGDVIEGRLGPETNHLGDKRLLAT